MTTVGHNESSGKEQTDPTTETEMEGTTKYETNPTVSYDSSDPDRGFTEDTPGPSIDGEDSDYIDSNYDSPFCNDLHDSHVEVHREFWDFSESQHECYFCHSICTVMQCPNCDVQACSHCKNTHG